MAPVLGLQSQQAAAAMQTWCMVKGYRRTLLCGGCAGCAASVAGLCTPTHKGVCSHMGLRTMGLRTMGFTSRVRLRGKGWWRGCMEHKPSDLPGLHAG